MAKEKRDVEEQCRDFRQMFESLRREIGKVIVGYEEIVEGVLTCLFCGGHVLLEGRCEVRPSADDLHRDSAARGFA